LFSSKTSFVCLFVVAVGVLFIGVLMMMVVRHRIGCRSGSAAVAAATSLLSHIFHIT